MNSLKKFDQFGVPFQLRTSAGNKSYKSWIGGLLTLILYTLCLLYTIYIFILWSNGSILPKVSSQLSASSSLRMSLSESFMKFSFALRNQTNPFTKQNNILMPLLLTENDGDFKNITSLFSDSTEINLPSVELIKNQISEKEEVTVIFVLCPCNKLLQLGQTCASDQEITEFLDTFSTFVTIFGQLEQYNPSKNQLDSISKDTILSFENSYILYNQIKLQSTNKLHDNGILFQNFQSERYLNNMNILSQIISKSFSKKNFQGLDPVFITLIRLDELETITTVIDVKLGEIFAQIGSIISVLLSLQLVASFYNQNRQTEELIDLILLQLFPKLKEVDIKRDIFGHIQSALLNGDPLNRYKFEAKYQQAKMVALQYLSVNSLIHKIIILEKKLNIPLEDLRLGSFHSVKFNQIVQESDPYQTPKEKTNSVSLVFDHELQD